MHYLSLLFKLFNIILPLFFISIVVLFYIKEKNAKWILLSIILNIISIGYFSSVAHSFAEKFSLFVWPLINVLVVVYLVIKNINFYRKRREEFFIRSKQSKARLALLEIPLILFGFWFSLVLFFITISGMRGW